MDSKVRFTDRVDAYVKYRPDYPEEALDYLYDTAGLRGAAKVADVGAGTGKFSRLLLERGSEVIAVEPNAAMRQAAVDALGGYPGFRAVAGSAEATGLAAGSVDYIVCAQAFHWFDRAAAKEEFLRVLKDGGRVALIWNSRLTAGSPFLEGYEQLIQTYGTDYVQVNHRNISAPDLAMFFREGAMREARFAYRQTLDYDGLKGRLLSSSYAPGSGHPRHEPMLAALRELFDGTSRDGFVFFDYETEIYWGEL